MYPEVQGDMMLAWLQRKMLFEILPQLPRFLCDLERELWMIFFEKNPDVFKMRMSI